MDETREPDIATPDLARALPVRLFADTYEDLIAFYAEYGIPPSVQVRSMVEMYMRRFDVRIHATKTQVETTDVREELAIA